MKKVLNIREPNVYARHLEAEVLHPLISVVHFDELFFTQILRISIICCIFATQNESNY